MGLGGQEQDGIQRLVPLTAVTNDEPPTVVHVVCPPTTPDGHVTVGGGLTGVDFGSPDIPPIPADFFEPGSQPFVGQVPFHSGSSDTIDTRVQRSGPLDFPGAGFPRPSSPIQIEIVALSLTSSAPITVGTSEWQVDLTLSDFPSPAGQLQATLAHENGGSFDATIPVLPKFVFTRIGDAQDVRILDFGIAGLEAVGLSFFNVPFVLELGAELANTLVAPSNGNFVPGVEEVVPGDSSSQETRQATGTSPGVQHTIRPPTVPRPPPEFPPDPHGTVEGKTAVIFGSPDVPPIPADFFGPGSDPFVGFVPLRGNGTDSVDTLVQRLDPLDFPGSALPRPSEPIPTEIVELSLTGGPIIVTENGGQNPQEWLIDLTLSDFPSPPGQLDATLEHANGGVFNHTLPVLPKFVFTSVADPTEQRTLDFASSAMPPIVLNFANVPFVIHLGQDLSRLILAPSNGNFVPGVQEVNPDDPSSQVVVAATGFSEGEGVLHTVIPAPRPPCLADTECDDGRECTNDACDVATGECFNTPLSAGTACGEQEASECADPAVCDEVGNCVFSFKPSGTPCNDGDRCTGGDRCDEFLCLGSDVSQIACDTGADCPEPQPTEKPYLCQEGFCVCEAAAANAPTVADSPHDRRKNRVISINPNNIGPIVMRVELLDNACSASGAKCINDVDCDAGETCDEQAPPVMLGWVGDPITLGAASQLPAGATVARVVKDMPAFRVWPETVVHVSDCEIAPVQGYAISASTDAAIFSAPLRIGTIKKPAGKSWGDYVASAAGGVFTPPNGILNVDDLSALLFFFQGRTVSDPEYVVTTLELAGETTTFVISASDLSEWLRAFGGGTYPPPSFLLNPGPPENCP